MPNKLRVELAAKKAAVVRQINKGSSFHVASAEGKSASRSSRQVAAAAMRAAQPSPGRRR